MFEVVVEYTDKTKVLVADAVASLSDALAIQDGILEQENPNIEFVRIERMRHIWSNK